MSPVKKAAPAKKTVAKRTPGAKKATTRKATATKRATTAKKSVAKRTTTARKTAAKRATTAKKAVAKRTTTARKTAAKRATTAKKVRSQADHYRTEDRGQAGYDGKEGRSQADHRGQEGRSRREADFHRQEGSRQADHREARCRHTEDHRPQGSGQEGLAQRARPLPMWGGRAEMHLQIANDLEGFGRRESGWHGLPWYVVLQAEPRMLRRSTPRRQCASSSGTGFDAPAELEVCGPRIRRCSRRDRVRPPPTRAVPRADGALLLAQERNVGHEQPRFRP